MGQSAVLSNVPQEVLERILMSLALADLKSLRLGASTWAYQWLGSALTATRQL